MTEQAMKVLQMLEDGKITVEQAHKLLGAVDQANGDEEHSSHQNP